MFPAGNAPAARVTGLRSGRRRKCVTDRASPSDILPRNTMATAPGSIEELSQAIADAHARGQRFLRWDLSRLARVLEHAPEDMTVTVEAGATLAALQERLRARGQWLPIDPPAPDALGIGALLATNASGPRRFGYGTAREHLIGLKAVLADGRVVKSGGKVVKNVAGYDLMKLFVGSSGTLGVIVEASFKVRPLPEAEQVVQARCDSLDRAADLIERILASHTTPVALDLHNLRADGGAEAGACRVVAAFAGTRKEVEWQLGEGEKLGLREPASLDYDAEFRTARAATPPLRQQSVLPSRLIETVRAFLGSVPFVARAGNGVIYHRGGAEPPEPLLPVTLMRRVKDAFDPKRVFPDLPW